MWKNDLCDRFRNDFGNFAAIFSYRLKDWVSNLVRNKRLSGKLNLVLELRYQIDEGDQLSNWMHLWKLVNIHVTKAINLSSKIAFDCSYFYWNKFFTFGIGKHIFLFILGFMNFRLIVKFWRLLFHLKYWKVYLLSLYSIIRTWH